MTASQPPQRAVRRSVQNPAEPESRVDLISADRRSFRPEDYAVGQTIGGRFRVERVIGVGSMGVVLAATHLQLQERVAIKFIRSEMQKLPGVVQRFAREAKAAVTMKSEHIAQVFDVGTEPGIGPFIVMEYLEGRDLGEALEEEGRLSIRQAVHYVMQACEALAVAHSKGITHRDIKPENLFLTRQGDLELIKLLDFGISKAALTGRVFGDDLSAAETTCLLGTPLYMSPEQIRSTDQVDHRSDIWSLGAVLYELITAESAFVADSISEVWHRILETEPAPLVDYCPEAPPALQAVINRCLEKDPSRRYSDVGELAVALLPFAPTRARAYAQRASSILGTGTDSAFPAPLPNAFVGPGSERSSAIITSVELIPAGSDVTAPPIGESHRHQLSAPPRRSFATAAVLLSAALFIAVAGWVGLRASSTPVARSVSPPEPVVTQAASAPAPQPTKPAMASSRSVLLESRPSGAKVEVNGQSIGITPLSSLLPVGAHQVAIEKRGYTPQKLIVQVDPAPEGSSPIVARVELTKAKPKASTRSSSRRSRRSAPKKKRRRAASKASARRPAPTQALAGSKRAESEKPQAAAAIEPEATKEATETADPPLVEEPPRPRLLGSEGRPKILD